MAQFKAQLLFPQEVWEQIFNHLTDPSDLMNVQKTCVYFRCILKRNSVDFLLQEVLTIIHPSLSQSANLCSRLASRCWKRAINYGVERLLIPEQPVIPSSSSVQLSDMVITPTSPPIVPFLSRLQTCYTFGNSLQEFLEIGQLMHLAQDYELGESPLIGNSISLKLSVVRRTDILDDLAHPNRANYLVRHRYFWQQLDTFFGKFGSQLSSVSIHIPNITDIRDSFYTSTRIYVMLENRVPNLKRLQLNGVVSDHLGLHSWLKAIRAPKLHTVEISLFPEAIPANITAISLQTVIDYVHSVPTVGVRQTTQSWNVWDELNLSARDWSALTQLYLTDVGSNINAHSIINANMPNLLKLGLKPKRADNILLLDAGYTFDDAMRILNGLSTTTNIHTFVNVGSFPLPQLSPGSVAPHKIKHLEIVQQVGYRHAGPAMFTFLYRFPSIESLRTTWAHSESVNPAFYLLQINAQFEVNSSLDDTDLNKLICGGIRPDRMRIWSILPNLKTLYVSNKMYCRPQ